MNANLYFCKHKINLHKMSKEISIKKGLKINLFGEAKLSTSSLDFSNSAKKFVVKPTDFHSLVPKLLVKVGDKVLAGTALFMIKTMKKLLSRHL